jgi:hypothetical protein
MSNGNVEVRVFRLNPEDTEAVIPGKTFDIEEEPPPVEPEKLATDVELELLHSNHLPVPDPKRRGRVSEESLWHDDLWRLRVRRLPESPGPAKEPHLYRVRMTYPTQLPILDREIEASFFHDGFNANYNDQQYITVELSSRQIKIDPPLILRTFTA